VSSYSDCMHPASREVFSSRHAKLASAVRPDSGQKPRSYDASCGFIQFCQKHIFANPTAISPVPGRARKMSQNPDTVLSNHGQCDSFSAHFNPCYSNNSPPDDDDDDINLDAVSLCDSLCSNRSRKNRALPALSEMSESCFDGLHSSTERRVIDSPRQFRPLSWAGPVGDCLISSSCSCFNPSALSAMKSETGCLHGPQLLNSVSEIASDELCMPLSAETPFYWELELPGMATGANLTSQTFPVPETCQKLASPLRMGTLTFDTGNMFESNDSHVAPRKFLPNKSLCQNSGSTVDIAKAPKMGCLPARCFICRECQRVCSASSINRHNYTVSGKTVLLHEVCSPQACRCMKQRRCPTPPRMLSPCVNDDESVGVPVADI